jgi:hypothetical protein
VSRRPPASGADLDALRRAIEPYELPVEVATLLAWADGQQGAAPWWPSIDCGVLLSAARIAEAYAWLCEDTEDWQWSPSWLPVASEGWHQAGVEMDDRFGVVIDASFPDPEVRVVAPSLTVMLDLVADMLEAGVALQGPAGDAAGYERWKAERAALVARRREWRRWPYDRVIASEVDGWPPHWRVAIGVPEATTYPHPRAQPIGALLPQGDGCEPVTVEGFIRHRELLDGQARGPTLVTLDDGTGTVQVLVQADTLGRYWAAWPGRRIQVDVDASPEAQTTLQRVLGTGDATSFTAECRIAKEVRHAVQVV